MLAFRQICSVERLIDVTNKLRSWFKPAHLCPLPSPNLTPNNVDSNISLFSLFIMGKHSCLYYIDLLIKAELVSVADVWNALSLWTLDFSNTLPVVCGLFNSCNILFYTSSDIWDQKKSEMKSRFEMLIVWIRYISERELLHSYQYWVISLCDKIREGGVQLSLHLHAFLISHAYSDTFDCYHYIKNLLMTSLGDDDAQNIVRHLCRLWIVYNNNVYF